MRSGTVGPTSEALVNACVFIHTTMEQVATRAFEEGRRRLFITPKLFLDLIHTFLRVLHGEHSRIVTQRSRLQNGLQLLVSDYVCRCAQTPHLAS